MTDADLQAEADYLMRAGTARRRAQGMMVLGGLLSLTGVGAVIGAPLALAGAFWRADQVVRETAVRASMPRRG